MRVMVLVCIFKFSSLLYLSALLRIFNTSRPNFPIHFLFVPCVAPCVTLNMHIIPWKREITWDCRLPIVLPNNFSFWPDPPQVPQRPDNVATSKCTTVGNGTPCSRVDGEIGSAVRLGCHYIYCTRMEK